MEAYTFINKETKDIIRYKTCFVNQEYHGVFYFTKNDYYPIWFVETKEEAELAYNKTTNIKHSVNYKLPSTKKVDINDYEIIKFKIEIDEI